MERTYHGSFAPAILDESPRRPRNHPVPRCRHATGTIGERADNRPGPYTFGRWQHGAEVHRTADATESLSGFHQTLQPARSAASAARSTRSFS